MNRRKSSLSDNIPLSPNKSNSEKLKVLSHQKTVNVEDELQLENISNISEASSSSEEDSKRHHKRRYSKDRTSLNGENVNRPATVNSNSTFLTSGIEYFSSSDEAQIKSPSYKKSEHLKSRFNKSRGTPIDSGNNSFDIDVIVHQENIPKTNFLVEQQSSSESEIKKPKFKTPVPLPRIKTLKNNDRQKLIDSSSHEPSLTSPVKQINSPSIISKSDKTSIDVQDSDDDVVCMVETERKTSQKNDDIIQLHEIKHKSQISYNYEKIIGIFIHHCDPLVNDFKVKHPRVKVHLFNLQTGKYTKKSAKERSVSFYQEHGDIDYIVPILSHPFNFIQNKSMTPNWEELIIFNDDFNILLNKEEPSIFMFEIMDNVEINKASSRYKKLGPEGGWRKIAWAFLKPVGSNGVANYNKKLRLQLYKPKKTLNSDDNQDVFIWWKSGSWDPYPATLYVTIKETSPPKMSPSIRSKTALQKEQSQEILKIGDGIDQIDNPSSHITNNNSLMEGDPNLEGRLPFQMCEIPNRKHLLIKTHNLGCFCLKFNHSGTKLACAIAEIDEFNIHIYSVPDFKNISTLYGHQELIYDLDWSSNNKFLLSASSDGMAIIWEVENIKPEPLQILPHPSFIYTAKFIFNRNFDVITGCYDNIIRFWSKSKKSSDYELVQELEGHESFVNSFCIKNHNSFLSGDNKGVLILWTQFKPKIPHQRHSIQWQLEKKIIFPELKDVTINRIIHHSWSERFIVHSRDNILRMVDIDNETIIHRYKGLLNSSLQKISCLSPCGNLLFAPSEADNICVWQVATGELIATYSGKKWYSNVTCVDYHPCEHMLAVSIYGTVSKPIIINVYDPKIASDNGLHLIMKYDQKFKPPLRPFSGGNNEEVLSSNLSFDSKSLLASTRIETPKSEINKNKTLFDIIEKMDVILKRESTPMRKPSITLEEIHKQMERKTESLKEYKNHFDERINSDKIDENIKLLKITLDQIKLRKPKEKLPNDIKTSLSQTSLQSRKSQTNQKKEEKLETNKKQFNFQDNIINSPKSEPINSEMEKIEVASPNSEKTKLCVYIPDNFRKKEKKTQINKSTSPNSEKSRIISPKTTNSPNFEKSKITSSTPKEIQQLISSDSGKTSPISEKISKVKESLESKFIETHSSPNPSIGGKTYSISSSLSSNHTYIIHCQTQSDAENSPKLFEKPPKSESSFGPDVDTKKILSSPKMKMISDDIPKIRPYSAGPVIDTTERISPARARYHKQKYLLPSLVHR